MTSPHPAVATHGVTDVSGRLMPATARFEPSSSQDSVIGGTCEGALTSIGVILPAGGLGTDCGPALTLKHGWRDGDPGTYVFLDLPACPENWCHSLQTSDRLRCEILIGNPCCYVEDLKGKELRAVTGTRIGPITDALQGRFDADTDRREGICHDRYLGNEARVLRVLIVEPASARGRDTYRVLGGGRLFLRARQDKSDDITGELVPVPPSTE
ncbi:MAG TPA: hypothetical protein VE326_09855 [Candidatus Binatia bacterium]|nr:hypothetical protein [Candidatus Binatia bacterium]